MISDVKKIFSTCFVYCFLNLKQHVRYYTLVCYVDHTLNSTVGNVKKQTVIPASMRSIPIETRIPVSGTKAATSIPPRSKIKPAIRLQINEEMENCT